MVQLALEYDPAPPFPGGSPAKAESAQVAAYNARADRLAPTRREDLIAAARRLGFSGD
jgi:cyclohexyl-isocyanide hydratase